MFESQVPERVVGTGRTECRVSVKQVRRQRPCREQAQQSRGTPGPMWGEGRIRGRPWRGEGWRRLEGTEGPACLPSEDGEPLAHRSVDEVAQAACTQERSPRPRNGGETGSPGALQQSGATCQRRLCTTSGLQEGQSLWGTITRTERLSSPSPA